MSLINTNLKSFFCKIFIMLIVISCCSCTALVKYQYYKAKVPSEWQEQDISVNYNHFIGMDKDYKYGHKCNEFLFWIHPSGRCKMLMAGLIFIPIFPIFFLNASEIEGKELSITIVSDDKNVDRLSSLVPIITPEGGIPTEPKHSKINNDHGFITFQYDLDISKVKSLTVTIESNNTCTFDQLFLTRQTALAYIPIY
jgi:hypothetical protein